MTSTIVASTPNDWRPLVSGIFAEAYTYAGRWSPQALVDAIQAAAVAARRVEVDEEVELVWTGPASLASTFRRTDRAWVETIEGARDSIWIASFTVGTIERIEGALAGALDKGVVVNLLFETTADSNGYLASNGFERFSPVIRERARIYRWPSDRRDRDERGNVGIMHAKCVVADQSVLFVSSANLSGAALERNLEVGIIVRGGRLPGWLAARFNELVSHGVIERIAL